MLMVISPAKTLDYTSPLATQEYSLPRYLEQSSQLIEVLRKLSPNQLAELMKLERSILRRFPMHIFVHSNQIDT